MVDAVVIGGGHAGIEAAWALSRLGHSVALVTFDHASIGRMSCNPSIGGLAKGQLVREIDALGGLMGRLIDRTGIHYRMLNRRKGPAVRAPRAQADKAAYEREARAELTKSIHLVLIAGEVTEIIVDQFKGERRVVGVKIGPVAWDRVSAGGAHSSGAAGLAEPARSPVPVPESADISYGGQKQCAQRGFTVTRSFEIACRSVVLTAGTFLEAKVFTGLDPRPGGRRGEPPADALGNNLRMHGLRLGRLKTGTPPRLRASTIDLRALEIQAGDEPPPRFSFYEKAPVRNLVSCHITHTNSQTHASIRGALDRSPLFSGLIQGVGPRYCPSIEDKVMRFPERASHHIFLEPEGLQSAEIYPNGISTSLPLDVQAQFVHTIPGLETAEIVHPGYAVEYTFLLTSQIDTTLAVSGISGLYAAGQINGTSGYEEAAAQGIVAGLNARAFLEGRPPFLLRRDQAYIGVLLDDLVTKIPTEPYRMFTSQSEYRLLLRQDNADLRLSRIGRDQGLLSAADAAIASERARRVADARDALRRRRIRGADVRLDAARSAAAVITDPMKEYVFGEAEIGKTLAEMLRRPEVGIADVAQLIGDWNLEPADEVTLEAETKYAGYLERQLQEIEIARNLEDEMIPPALLASPPTELSNEAREMIMTRRPRTLGQAARMPGVTPCDISLLVIRMRAHPASSSACKSNSCGDQTT